MLQSICSQIETMMQERKELWRKDALDFVVEIRVGNSWVTHSTEAVLSKASEEAETIIKDPSVREVRILEYKLHQVCSNVYEEEGDTVLRIPPKMSPTGRKQECPVCAKMSPVATDGTTEWIFCGKCDRANPA